MNQKIEKLEIGKEYIHRKDPTYKIMVVSIEDMTCTIKRLRDLDLPVVSYLPIDVILREYRIG